MIRYRENALPVPVSARIPPGRGPVESFRVNVGGNAGRGDILVPLFDTAAEPKAGKLWLPDTPFSGYNSPGPGLFGEMLGRGGLWLQSATPKSLAACLNREHPRRIG